jgi:hypothetical protein
MEIFSITGVVFQQVAFQNLHYIGFDALQCFQNFSKLAFIVRRFGYTLSDRDLMKCLNGKSHLNLVWCTH